MLVLALLCPALCAGVSAESGGFGDVPTESWYADGVASVCEAGIMKGVADGVFEPRRTMSRAEFVTAIYALSGDTYDAGAAHFADVKPGAWYADAVEWAANRITDGTGDGKFSPSRPLTRAEACAMLVLFQKSRGEFFLYKNKSAAFADRASIPAWTDAPVGICRRAGYVCGTGENLFCPAKELTRAEAAVMLAAFIAPRGYLLMGNSLTAYGNFSRFLGLLCDAFYLPNTQYTFTGNGISLAAIAESYDYEDDLAEYTDAADVVILQEAVGTWEPDEHGTQGSVAEIMSYYNNSKLTFMRFTQYDIYLHNRPHSIYGTDDVYSGLAFVYLMNGDYDDLFTSSDLLLDDGYSHPTPVYSLLNAQTCFRTVFAEQQPEIVYESLPAEIRALADSEHFAALDECARRAAANGGEWYNY